MSTVRLRYALPAVLLVTSLGGLALAQFQRRVVTESAPVPPAATAPVAVTQINPPKTEDAAAAKVEDAKPAPGRRREAVIKVPAGTFVKDVDAGEYGSGRIKWTFEDDKVFGTIEASVMGVEVELRTEAEFSLSSSGTIYGIVTGFELAHLKFGALGKLDELGAYAKFVKLAEPLVNEMLIDLPFSYQFRLSGDKLTILNYRALLAGPNPLGKLGGLAGGEAFAAVAYFQALGMAVEGTYTAGDPEPRDKAKVKPIVRKPTVKK